MTTAHTPHEVVEPVDPVLHAYAIGAMSHLLRHDPASAQAALLGLTKEQLHTVTRAACKLIAAVEALT